MQVNTQEVEHDLRCVEQIDSRLYKCISIIILLIFLHGCRHCIGKADDRDRVSDCVGYTLLQCDYNSVHPC